MKKTYRVLVNYTIHDFDTLEEANNYFEKVKPNLELGFSCGQVKNGTLFLFEVNERKMIKEYEKKKTF